MVLDDAGRALRDKRIAEASERHRAAVAQTDWAAMQYLQNPAIGDLVLELTRASRSKDQHTRTIGFGYLLAQHGDTWFIQYGPDPDDVASWESAMFIRAEPVADEPSGYTPVCPGVAGYGRGLGRTVAHGADCCARFAAMEQGERERIGLRIPNRR